MRHLKEEWVGEADWVIKEGMEEEEMRCVVVLCPTQKLA